VVRERGKHYIEDLAGKETTQFAEKAGEPVETLRMGERRELKPGNRVIIGSAVAFVVRDEQG
jgi:hypothetical protein